jgi:MFS family permease
VDVARRTLGLAVVTFAAFAMPKAAFGVAWPSLAGDLGFSVGQLGLVIAVYMAGYLLSTVCSGAVAARIGAGRMLTGAAWINALTVVGYAIVPTSGLLLLLAVVLGIGAGFLDAGINTHVALRHGARAMGVLHAGFGIGATLGPLLMTLLLAAGASWRLGFALLAVVQLVVAVMITVGRRGWTTSPVTSQPTAGGRRLPAVAWWTLVLFVLYTAFEVAASQWAFTLFTEGRGLSEVVAGLAVTGFYAALTAARLLLGGLGHRMPAARLSTAGGLLALVAMTLVWLAPQPWVGPAALVACGFALGPIFPLQMVLTPRRIGSERTAAMVGYQTGSAAVGASLGPGLIGILVGVSGVAAIAPALVAGAGALVLADLRLRRFGVVAGAGLPAVVVDAELEPTAGHHPPTERHVG